DEMEQANFRPGGAPAEQTEDTNGRPGANFDQSIERQAYRREPDTAEKLHVTIAQVERARVPVISAEADYPGRILCANVTPALEAERHDHPDSEADDQPAGKPSRVKDDQKKSHRNRVDFQQACQRDAD